MKLAKKEGTPGTCRKEAGPLQGFQSFACLVSVSAAFGLSWLSCRSRVLFTFRRWDRGASSRVL